MRNTALLTARKERVNDAPPRIHQTLDGTVLKGGLRQEGALPNILVYIDIRERQPTGPALFALSEARRVARLAGASIFAVVATSPLTTDQLEALATPIAEAGADKLLLCEAADFANPPLDATHGRALDAATARVPPILVLFPAGGAGAALGPPLAARLGGPFAPWCDFLTSDSEVLVPDNAGRVQLVYLRSDGRSLRRLDPMDIERPIVATLGAGRRAPASGKLRNLEVEVLACIDGPPDSIASEKERTRDPHAAIELASVLALVADTADVERGSDVDSAAMSQILKLLDAQHHPDTVVVRVSDVSPAILAACCPDVLVKIGPCPATTARSPRTRVVFVAPPGWADLAPDDVDIVWQVQSADDLTAASLGALLVEIGGIA